MDTSAGATQKATTEEEKRQYREKGRCFKCGKQGHLARNCPDKRTRARVANVDTTSDTTSEAPSKTTVTTANQISASDIAARVIKMTDDEKAELVRVMRAAGEDVPVGFQEA